MAYSWAKLWIEMLDDRKTGALPDSSWRRFVECILLAMETNRDGVLPSVPDMAWRLRVTPETMADDLTRLALAGLVSLNESDEWVVTNFTKRQAAIPVSERVASHRARKKQAPAPPSNDDVTPPQDECNEDVTERYTDKTRSEQEETRGEGDKNARVKLHPATARVMAAASPLPPPIVRYESTDRTPGGKGFTEPPEPEPVKKEPIDRDPAIGEMANALTDVTGVSARLNWPTVRELAEDLHAAGYTAEQVRVAYSKQPTAGAWHWYAANWKGKRGDMPTLKDVRETIAGATARPTQTRKPGPIERALAMLNQSSDPSAA